VTPSHSPLGRGSRPARASWASAVGAATTTALAHPGAWPVALVGVLVRGGLVTLVLPIVVLPTTIGLATALGPAIVAIALGQPDAGVARLVALVVGSAIGWLLVSALLGAWTDTWLIAWLAADLEEPSAGAPNGPAATGPPAEVRGGTVLRVVVVRAIAHLPLLVAAGWGFARLVEVARLELILPSDLRVPIVVRVALGAPEVFALIALTWVVGEALGALAARTVVLERASSAQALLQAAASAVRHLPATAATLLATPWRIRAGR
jgi:hypothetical protein